MINYTEKGYGLHELITSSGHWLMQRDGVWVSSDDTAVQAIIDGYTLDTAKAIKCLEISLKAKSLRDKVVATVSAGEMASWSLKAIEAVRFNASQDPAHCPMLSIEAASRGITLEQLVAKVNANTAKFSTAEAAIGGTDGRHRDAINAMTSFEEICAYDYNVGWPNV